MTKRARPTTKRAMQTVDDETACRAALARKSALTDSQIAANLGMTVANTRAVIAEGERLLAAKQTAAEEEWAKRKLLTVNPGSLISIWETATTWLSESPNSRYERSEVVDRLFDIVHPVDGKAPAPFTIFDREGRPRREDEWAFEFHASTDAADIAPHFFLSLEEVRHWSQSSDGLQWSTKLGLRQQPAFLFGEVDEVARHQLMPDERREGGSARKYDAGFQKLVNIAAEDLAAKKQKLTEGELAYWIQLHCKKAEFETGIADCDRARIEENRFVWVDETGVSRSLGTRSTQPYINRAKAALAKKSRENEQVQNSGRQTVEVINC